MSRPDRPRCATAFYTPPYWRAVAQEHRDADVRCGRPWVCACGPCRVARTGKLRKPKEEK